VGPAQATADGRTADPLSDALLYLAAHHGRAISRDALVAGLPLEEGRLSAGLFARAAQRAGLETEPVKRAIPEIPALVLPAVLVMRDGSTRILLALDSRKGTATVLDPTTGEAPRQISVGELSLDYLGYVFFVRPAVTADARTMAAGDVPRAHWFWSVVRRFWSNYSHVAIAALLVNILGLAAPLFIMSVYDRVIPNGAIPSLVALSIGMVLAISFEFVLRMVRSRIIDMTGKQIDVVLAANLFEHVLAVKMAQRPTSVGILANQVREFDSVREFFTSGSVVSATDLIFAILFVGVLFIIAGPLALIPLVMLPIIIILFITELAMNTETKMKNALLNCGGIIYVSLFLFCFYPLTAPPFMINTTDWFPEFAAIPLGIVLLIWANDTFAYFTGSLIGITKILPSVSPKKSWEGFIGGSVFAILTGWILSKYFTQLNVYQWISVAIIISVTGTIGDFFESFIKRKAEVKDSGNLLPGHGGFLDRFDALIFCLPFVTLYINAF